MLKKLLLNQYFSRSVMVEQKEWTQSSTRKLPREAVGKQ